jgi:cytochrome c biogenesis protein CcmG, thiol:disulfide interchange protein DsbE
MLLLGRILSKQCKCKRIGYKYTLFFQILNINYSFMKQTILFLSFFCLALSATAQDRNLPAANVKTLEGQAITVKSLAQEGKITVFSFWATWCKPCIQELDAIKDLYPDWQEKYGVEYVAVSVDDARTLARVKPFITNKDWPYTIVTDAAKEFQTALNVTNPPLTIIVNQKGDIIFSHLGYTPGDELEVEEKIKAASEKK